MKYMKKIQSRLLILFRPMSLRSLCSLMILGLLLGQGTLVAQASIPHAYWQYQEPFNQANASGDYATLIPVARDIQNLMETQEDNESTRGILYTVYEALATAYEAQKNYELAIHYLQKQIEYAYKLGFDDAIILAEKRITQINPNTEVYALSQNLWQLPYYGAKHEPVVGAYFGRTHGSSGVLAHESAVSVYVECFQEEISGFD